MINSHHWKPTFYKHFPLTNGEGEISSCRKTGEFRAWVIVEGELVYTQRCESVLEAHKAITAYFDSPETSQKIEVEEPIVIPEPEITLTDFELEILDTLNKARFRWHKGDMEIYQYRRLRTHSLVEMLEAARSLTDKGFLRKDSIYWKITGAGINFLSDLQNAEAVAA